MPTTPFFSIIIPVYNAGAYLQECLQSILAQDFQDWEAILVDDCSTDDSVAIGEEFTKTDSRIKLVKSSVNSGGAYSPRMRGANLASGEFLVIIDADDSVSPDLLSTHLQKISSANADLVIPEMWKHNGNVWQKILPLESIDVEKTWIGKNLVTHTLCRWEIPMAGFAVRREIYLRADNQLSGNDKKSIFADELLSRWIFFISRRVCFTSAHYYYRYNDNSVTHTNITRFIDSKLVTCDSLIAMTSKAFGYGSPTHLRALDNKFLSAVELLRLINKTNLEKKTRETSVNRVSLAMKFFDLKNLEGRISTRYLALMSLPLPLARLILKILDPIMRKKVHVS